MSQDNGKSSVIQSEGGEMLENFQPVFIVSARNVKRMIQLNNLICSQCDFQGISRSHLLLHTRKHTGEKPFQCELCQKKFSRKSTLKTHMLTHQDLKGL